ncbi:TatD family hydrolase [Romeria aff. gracilis LEGE 07310]|uniref:D-aminoacyl-tRNA deacylase n=1 Tax=Vasconcelosia minhoensis LEGE 07310 TaxID=915328 RepID=A0A8J7DDR1_9CYAN|nr:TatD family hydrolase [Romeria gracilis]MBE9079058.1 TatD family hydrolase [Romeria aff. gracilis LEGE 07310]
MQLVDTHVHLNFESFDADLDAVAQAWRQAGIVHLVHSCVTPADFDQIQAIANRYPEISFAVGLHPLDMDQWSDQLPDRIHRLAQSDGRVVAIGEIGLDFFKSDDAELQKAAFQAQLAVAQRLGLPVIIHCREAAAEMAELLEAFWQVQGPVAGVMHCWTGDPAETQRFLDLGFFISFSGIVTFKNAAQVKASAQRVPRDRLLVETDCPFLSPVPKRKEKRNQPAFVRHVAEHVAELRNVSLETLAAQTTDNARRLFKLPAASFESPA